MLAVVEETSDTVAGSAPPTGPVSGSEVSEPAGDRPVLSDGEVRVLGCLLEKAATTPEYYPLTLNALTAACNQKSNRDPMMQIEDSTVLRITADLQVKELCGEHHTAGSRVIKYGHNIKRLGEFTDQEKALLAVLMLRGPQTVGELKGRTNRYCRFENLAQVESVLQGLATRESGPLVVKLPREAGRKEGRYAHLLGGPVHGDSEDAAPAPHGTVVQVQAENARISALEEQVAALRAELTEVKESVEALRRQWE